MPESLNINLKENTCVITSLNFEIEKQRIWGILPGHKINTDILVSEEWVQINSATALKNVNICVLTIMNNL